MADKTVRWGIISTANIGTAKVIPGDPAVGATPRSWRSASRDLCKAQAAASRTRHRQGLWLLRGDCWPIRKSTRSTIRCPTICMCRSDAWRRRKRGQARAVREADRPDRTPRTRSGCAIARLTVRLVLEAFIDPVPPAMARGLGRSYRSGELGDDPGDPRGVHRTSTTDAGERAQPWPTSAAAAFSISAAIR